MYAQRYEPVTSVTVNTFRYTAEASEDGVILREAPHIDICQGRAYIRPTPRDRDWILVTRDGAVSKNGQAAPSATLALLRSIPSTFFKSWGIVGQLRPAIGSPVPSSDAHR
ncbi:MAG TPA: hypothetical protein VFZ66_18470 [Herpetosiphonaceae bacterium]